MHYENGHEVSQQLAAEVYQLAFANTKAWTRRESIEETYMCQHGNLIALKLHAQFDCLPEVLLSVILNRQHEWDLNMRSQEILEEYDIYNKIKLLTLQMPMANKVIHMCLYFCVAASQNKQFHIVYQSIDHDRIPPYEPVVPVYPSGFFISPVPGEPNKCQLTSVFQFPSEYPDNPKVVASLATSSERIIAGLKGVVARFHDSNDNWDQITNDIRKTMYNTMLGLDSVNGWSLRFQRKGLRTYTKQYAHEFRVATRTTFSLPYRSHEVAAELFFASQNTAEWDQFVTDNDMPQFVNPSTFIQILRYGDLQKGTQVNGHMLCSMQSIKDNVCDVSYKVAYEDPPAAITGWVHGFLPSGGFIVYPVGDNPSHSTVQCMVETRHTTKCSDEQIKIESVRVLHYWNSLVGYVSAKLRERIDASIVEKPPQLLPNVKLVGSSEPYQSVMDAFSKLVMQDNVSSIFANNMPEAAPTIEPFRTGGKRKHLMNVDDVVFTNPRSAGAPSKPFLFLVSDDGLAHRFLRRRLESPLVGSRFDSLPQEIIIEIFKFLDSSGLDNIARTCTHFKELVVNCNLWRSLYSKVWGDVKGRVALRYCGDDDPITFFSSFPDWKELYLERQYIEAAWEAPERRALSFTVTKAHSRAVHSMDLLPSRHRLVTGSQDRLVRVWDVTSGACLAKLPGTSACISVAAWGETHAKVAYKDGVVRVFDVMNEQCSSESRLGDTMRGCIFAKNSIISWHDNAVYWDETTTQPIATFTGHIQRIKSCALCPSKNILYTASRDTTVRLWDLHNQTKIGTISGHTRAVNTVALLGTNMCITGSSDKLAKVWDLRKLNAPIHVLTGHTGKLKCIKYSDIGDKICTGGDDGVNLWKSTDFSHLRKDFEGECVVSIALDEESVAYGGINGQIQYYDFTPHR